MTDNTVTPSSMTAAERTDLRSLIRQRARLMKTELKQRRLELMADFERQLSATFSYDQDETWKSAHALAEQALDEAESHVEWLLRHHYRTPAEWLGEEGYKHRRQCGYKRPEMSKKIIKAWEAFSAEHDGKSLSDIEALIEAHFAKEATP